MRDKLTRRTVMAGAALAQTARPAPARQDWPVFGELEEKAVLDVLRSGKWSRSSGGKRAIEFEARYAELTGAKYCLATANGTSALIAALNACDVGPGDAVLLPPYTFVATLNVVLLQHALPIFVDSDLETFQIDAGKLDAAVTPECRVVLPVHLGGAAADLDTILAFAKRRGLKVIEDACQSHLGEWRGKKVGTLGDCGCFSFQASKNLNSGEGGALVTNDEALMDRAYAFHGNGRGRKAEVAGFTYASNGANLRLTDFQGALLLAQMTRLEEQSRRREQNAKYLAAMLAKIPGIKPARLYDGCTRNAWHLFMFRLESGAGVSRARFLKNLSAKGVSGSSGYSPLNKEPFLKRIIEGRHYKRVYGERRIREWVERNNCPVNDRLCQEAVWFSQTTLLGSRSEMEQIAEAVSKARTA